MPDRKTMHERRFVRNNNPQPRLTSVLKRLKTLGIRFSHKDLVNISSLISLEYQFRYNQSPPKIKQREGTKIFYVRAFEQDFVPVMDEMISLYFSKDEEKRMEVFHSARTNPSGPMARLRRRLRKRKRKSSDSGDSDDDSDE
ncbi:MAG: hypothetical protein KDD99_04170 [Bacteroidetes bacterium]|nr:hypothetical protein [Bacteroidota bacterium]